MIGHLFLRDVARRLTARPVPADQLCACAHDADIHRHYRPGSDCGVCGAEQCARYQPVDLAAVRRDDQRGDQPTIRRSA